MNKSFFWRMLKYSAALALGSCAQVPHTPHTAPIEPLFRVSNSPGSAYGYVLLGAYYAGQNRTGKAAEAYRQAIELDPDMVEARNALAMLHAEEGRYDEAVNDLVIAVRLSPKAAKFHNNLGYVYHLKADYAAAVDEFRSALALDAHHALASNNLQASCDRLAVVAQRHPLVLAQGDSRLLEAVPCGASSLADHPGYDTAEKLLDTALAYLRRGAALATSFAMAQADAVAPEAAVAGSSKNTRAFRLEIANGNGIPGLARRVRDALRQGDSPAPRLTNMKSFTQRDTAIQYRLGFHEAARLLSLKIPTHPRLFHDPEIAPAVDVRLMLGKDITARAAMAIQEYSASERFAAAAREGKEAMSGESNARTIARE